jgi:hypothetical protein
VFGVRAMTNLVELRGLEPLTPCLQSSYGLSSAIHACLLTCTDDHPRVHLGAPLYAGDCHQEVPPTATTAAKQLQLFLETLADL